MSGHSKWSTIKRKKGIADQARGKVFQKLAKEIYVAAKMGDPNPENNANLRMIIEKAKAENMPKNNIQNAIDKASNKNNNENYEFVRYEGYGPYGIAIIIDCLTDNRNRTAGFVRSTLTKRSGNLGTDGSVSYMFERKGLIIVETSNIDNLMEEVLELDVEEINDEENSLEIITSPDKFLEVKQKIESLGYDNFLVSEVTNIPNNYLTLEEEEKNKVLDLISELEDLDDVQNVYHNLDI